MTSSKIAQRITRSLPRRSVPIIPLSTSEASPIVCANTTRNSYGSWNSRQQDVEWRKTVFWAAAATAAATAGSASFLSYTESPPEENKSPQESESIGHSPDHKVTPRARLNDWITALSKGHKGGDMFEALSGIETAGDQESQRKGDPIYGPMVILSGSSTPRLAEEIATHLKMKPGNLEVKRFRDGEIDVKLHDNVRGCDCFVIQSTCKPVNESLMELLLIVSSLRRASASRITAVIPYYGYKRDIGRPHGWSFGQHTQAQLEEAVTKKAPMDQLRAPLFAADVALMLETLGVDRIVSVDLQPPGHGQIEGFFSSRVPVDNLRSTIIAVNHFVMKKLHKPVIVATNENCIELAQDFRSALSYLKGGEYISFAAAIEKGEERRPGVASSKAELDRDPTGIDIVGDVKDRDVIIVDDLVDTSGTLYSRVNLLKERGARNIYCFCVHGLLNGEAVNRIATMPLTEIALTNTVPWQEDSRIVHVHKFSALSVAPLLAEAIQRLHNGESLQHLRIVDRTNVSRRYRDQSEEDIYQ
eukprot:gb/GECG01012059.1/.p1 GENE.gb/GECG01012059.1/~~gb/GECG01012059.1/.p1  ORF type:complete len:530 (+),score=57.31 gb/GECG01012059.1/:1-1590(+)